MYRRAQGVFVVLACAGLVACAGDGGDQAADKGGSTAVSAPSFEAQYAELTASYQSRIEEIQAQGRAALEGGQGDVLAVYGELGSAIESASADFDAVEAPDHVRPQYERLVSLLQEQATALDAVVVAAKAKDDAGVATSLQSFAQLLTDFATAQQALQQELDRK